MDLNSRQPCSIDVLGMESSGATPGGNVPNSGNGDKYDIDRKDLYEYQLITISDWTTMDGMFIMKIGECV